MLYSLIQIGVHSDKNSKETHAITPRVSLNLGRLLKLITTTTNITNETLVSLGAQMPTATGVAFICSPVATATLRQTACQVEPSCLTSGVISLCLESQWDSGAKAMDKLLKWAMEWGPSEDLLQADPPANCVVYFQDQQRPRRRYQKPQLQISPHGKQHDRGSLRKLHVRGHQQAGDGQRQRVSHRWVVMVWHRGRVPSGQKWNV